MQFRDVSAWYRIVHAIDTTTGTATNRLRVYVNGTEITSFSMDQEPSQNADLRITDSTGDQSIGDDPRDSNDLFDGYMAEYNFVDGITLDPTYFGEFNNNGVWIPKKPDVSSYGTNGFFLEFQNSGSLGTDTSGNGNNFTATNLTATDQTTDTPTNNFCTFNSIAPDTTGANNHDFYEGNTLIISSSANWFNAFGTIGIPQNGKWYFEYKTTGSGTIDQLVGFCQSNFHRGGDGGADIADCYTLYAASNGNGFLFTDSPSSTNKGTSYCWTHGDIIMVAIDTSSRKIWYGKNGSWLGGGNPATGSSEDQTVSAEDLEYGLLPVISGYHTGSSQFINFGNPAFSISSSNSDANGYGNFEYAVPSGYHALCTKNIAEYG